MSIPTTDTQPLFELSQEGFEQWHAALPIQSPGDYRRALNSALQLLTTQSLPTELLEHVLDKLRPAILIESHRLTQAITAKSGELDEKSRRLAWLGAHFPGELAKAYLRLIKVKQDETGECTSDILAHVHRALECLELNSLRSALFYEYGSSSFWSRAYELYAIAERQNQTSWKPAGIDENSTTNASIGALFLRLLTFRLASPNQLSTAQIRKLYELLHAHGGLIRLTSHDSEKSDFRMDFGAPQEPEPINFAVDHEASERVRYLGYQELRTKLALLSQPSIPDGERIDEVLSAHLQSRLGGLPNFQQDSKTREAALMTEFDGIVAKLSLLEVLSEEQESETSAGLSLEILPLGHETAQDSLSRPGSKSAGTFQPIGQSGPARSPAWNLQKGEIPCRVRRAESPGFYLLEPTGAVASKALVAINTDNKLVQLGITGARQPRASDKSIPFELFANELAPVNVYLDSAPTVPHKAILGTLAMQHDGQRGLFAKAMRLHCGDSFTLERHGRRQRVKVAKVRELTPQFGAFEVALDPLR